MPSVSFMILDGSHREQGYCNIPIRMSNMSNIMLLESAPCLRASKPVMVITRYMHPLSIELFGSQHQIQIDDLSFL